MTETELDELLTIHWPRVIRRAMVDGDEWTQTFAKSIARQGKRRNWMPSARQAEIMRRLVSELGRPDEEPFDLIEDEGGHRRIA